MNGPDERPEGARVLTSMIGSTTGDIAVTWTERDVMLYALGVGAGVDAPGDDLLYTTENSAGVTLRTIPAYVTALALIARPPALSTLDTGRFLHAGQWFALTAPLPTAGDGIVCNTVEQVLNRGSDAFIVNRATLHLAGSQQLLAEVRSSIFVRGGGGIGGPRSDFAEWQLPGRPADARISHKTRVEQALLYRLSGDRHPLHSDPVFARLWGFDRPILHGLCTYGIACRALVAGMADGDPTRLLGMDGRFRKPVIPGDSLTTEIWHCEDGTAKFRTLDGGGEVVLDRGTAILA